MRRLTSLQRDLRQLDLRLLGSDLSAQKDPVLGPLVRAQQHAQGEEKAQKKAQLALARHDFIQSREHHTARAYRELPHFFKFCLFKTRPRRFLTKGRAGEFIEPTRVSVSFRGLRAEVTYYEGELGDTDRLVYLAILNEAIRHRAFVQEFGKIPFSIEELADKAGFSSCSHRRDWVQESLDRLKHTTVHFLNGFGDFQFKGKFSLIDSYYSIERVKAKTEVNERLLTVREQALADQAQALLDKFKPRTPKLTFVTFNQPLMAALAGHQVTTVDMWALQRLSGNPARTLFLFLWDVSQWRHSQDPFEMSLNELVTLMDISIKNHRKNGREYIHWKESRGQVEKILSEVNQVAQFIDWYEWEGEKEQTRLRIKLSNDILQIPQL